MIYGLPESYAEAAKPTPMYDSQSTFELLQVSKESSAQTEKTFVELCQQKLNIVVSPYDISTCHRLRKSKSRSMIIRFANRKMKIAIIKAKKALPGSVVFINEHLTRDTSAMFAKAPPS